MKKYLIALSAIVGACSNMLGQISQGGYPFDLSPTQSISTITTPSIPLDELRAEDLERDQYKEFGYRFGYEMSTDLNPQNSGEWRKVGATDVWIVDIVCPEAFSVSLFFDQFKLKDDAYLFIKNPETGQFIGSLTSANNKKWGSLSTGVVAGDHVQVQLVLPEGTSKYDQELQIGTIIHGYRDILRSDKYQANAQRGPFGNSGACNINVNCPEGDPWQCEKKSVALIVEGSWAVCSGAMINNTSQDGTPYFLTADHCISFASVNNWLFYFNHEAAMCNGNTGPIDQSVSGATVVASNGDSDFALLELSTAPPADFSVHYAGWDKSGTAPDAVTGIHHPSGDVKKICFDTDGPSADSYGGVAVWYISEWEDGVTEGGSSGSPLFDENHRIVGQLYAGAAACQGQQNNGDFDVYGRLDASWDGPNPNSRLKDWLDPTGSDALTLGGFLNCGEAYALDAAVQGILNVPQTLCDGTSITPSVNLANFGSDVLTSVTIEVTYNGNSAGIVEWSGSLGQWENDEVSLPAFSPVLGENIIEVALVAPNGGEDENASNNNGNASLEYLVGEEQINVTIYTDDYGYEIFWQLSEPDGEVLATGGNTNVGINGGGAQVAAEGDPGAYGDNQLIEETIDFYPWGCYEFTIVDDWGDGICCDYGEGYYEITDAYGNLLASGSGYGETDTRTFGMINGLSINEKTSFDITLFPNPAEDFIMVNHDPMSSEARFEILDNVGRIVYQGNVLPGANQTEIVINDLVGGIYHLRLIDQNTIQSREFVLK